MTTRFRVYIRDRPRADFTMPIIGEVDAYKSFECTLRHLDFGAWQMTIPAGEEQADLIRPGRGIVVYLADDSTEPVFTGPIRTIKLTRSKEETGKGLLTVTGPCDNKVLAERVGRGRPRYPFSQEGIGDFSNEVQLDWVPLVYDGSDRTPVNSGEWIWGLIVENYVLPVSYQPQDLSRRLNYLAVPRQVPASVKALPADTLWKGFPIRMSDLPDTVFALAAAANLTVRFKWLRSDSKIHLVIARVVNRSEEVVFDTTLGNLLGFEFTSEAPESTRVILAGATPATEGGRRYYQYRKNDYMDPSGWLDVNNGGAASGWSDPNWGRQAIEAQWNVTAESLVDVRETKYGYVEDLSNPGDAKPPTPGSVEALRFAQTALTTLVESGAKGAFVLDAADTDLCRFGRDYGVSDVVRALVDTSFLPDTIPDADGVIRQQIREIRLSSDAADLWRLQPTVGSADGTTTPYIYRTLRKLKAKVDAAKARE